MGDKPISPQPWYDEDYDPFDSDEPTFTADDLKNLLKHIKEAILKENEKDS